MKIKTVATIVITAFMMTGVPSAFAKSDYQSVAILAIMTPNVNASEELPPGIISVEPQNETCPEGYDITKDGQHCVRAQEVDCNRDPDSPLCTGETGRGGSIFCDEYAGLTGSWIAYGGCYDRNDNVGEYCDKYHEEEEQNGDGWSCKETLC